jgi:aminoglycoside phosphotransferase (APT) family kinase protein
VHGDIAVGNVLLRDGRLSAVIDFGTCAVGDPACDLVISWLFLDEPARRAFRAALPFDPGTWARARGWALWKGLLVAASGGVTHPVELPPLSVAQLVMAEARVEGV